MSEELGNRVDQIRRAHGQAKPKDSNPAWKNCHRDMTVMFEYITELEHQIAELQQKLLDTVTTINNQSVAVELTKFMKWATEEAPKDTYSISAWRGWQAAKRDMQESLK